LAFGRVPAWALLFVDDDLRELRPKSNSLLWEVMVPRRPKEEHEKYAKQIDALRALESLIENATNQQETSRRASS
jgi:hypothetical protein